MRRTAIRLVLAVLILSALAGIGVALSPRYNQSVYLPMVESPAKRISVYVERCIDGDTFMARVPNQWPSLAIDGQLLEVTHLGANAPRLGECYGYEALGTHRALIEGQWVELEWGESQVVSGAFVAHVWYERDGSMHHAAEDLIWLGAAKYDAPWPSVGYRADLQAAEQAAKAELRGLWAECVAYPLPVSTPSWGPYPYPEP